MVHEGSINWLHTILMMVLTIKNSIKDSKGLSPEYIVYFTPIRMPVDMLDGSRVVLLSLGRSKRCRRSRIWCTSAFCTPKRLKSSRKTGNTGMCNIPWAIRFF